MRGKTGGVLSGLNVKVSMQYIIFSLTLQVPTRYSTSSVVDNLSKSGTVITGFGAQSIILDPA